MNIVKAIAVMPIAFASVAVATQDVRPAAVGLSDQEPQVVAFYNTQCNGYADAQGLQGAQRDAYLQQCLGNAPHVWPVGIDESDS
jgi:hypothetical protein